MRAFGVVVAAAFVVTVGTAPAHAQDAKKPEGHELFLKYKCQSCHSIASAGIEKKKAAPADEAEEVTAEKSKKEPPDLSATGVAHKADWLAAFLMKKEKTKEGKLHTKKFKGTDAELEKIVAWLEKMKDAKAAEKASAKK